MELLEFRKTVETLLKAELGYFPNGTPAMWVDSGDALGKPNGLLCVIERQPNMIDHTGILNHQAMQHFDWIIKLVQYDRTPAGLSKFDNACQKLRRLFPNHRERALPPTDGTYPQVTFLCNFHALINTYIC